MAEFNKDEAYAHQDKILNRIREARDSINRDIIDYYSNATIDSEEKFHANMQGMHKYLRSAYDWIGQILGDIQYWE